MNSATTPFTDLDRLFAALGDAILVVDRQGDIVLWNPAAERIFGFSAEEALGQPLDIIIPEHLQARHNDGFRKSVESGQTRYGESVLRVPALHKSGRTLSISFTVGIVSGPDGDKDVQAIVAVVRDETAKWQEERELRARLKACEEKKVQ
ncbi:MAG: PAS domain S-box protein [Desulfobulbaceae bacterium]|nr:PAS domain S-box protein [Desulfobulbaceae bacterium]